MKSSVVTLFVKVAQDML